MRVPHRPAFAALAGLSLAVAGTAAAAAVVPAGPATGPAAARAVATRPAPVVLVGTGGIPWTAVNARAAPSLARLADAGAIGAVTVRGVRTTACPVDGWLALSAGRRAGDPDDPDAPEPARPPCRPIEVQNDVTATSPGVTASSPGPATVTSWPRYRTAAASGKFDAEPGLLGQTLGRAGTCAAAVGPGAAVALAVPAGRPGAGQVATVQRYQPDLPAPDALAATLADPACPLTVIDAGAVRDPRDAPQGATETDVAVAPGDRADQLRAVDTAVGAVLAAAPADARVLVVSLADSGRTPRLQAVATGGPGFGPGLLRTTSTRQVALVQATDLAPTVLALLDLPAPASFVGSPLQTLAAPGQAPANPATRLRKVTDLERSALRIQDLVSPFFNGLVIAQLVLYGAAAVVLRGGWASGARRRRLLDLVRRVALVFACVPAATYLANTVPWWRAEHPMPAIVGAVAGYVVVLAVIAQLGPWRRFPLGAFGAVAGMTAVVLAVDVLTGSRLQVSSLMGSQPVVAGRFYGFGNVSYALFATGALLLAVAVADHLAGRGRRRAAGLGVAAIGVVATALDVSPAWGSDFGGTLALLPAFALLTLLVLGIRLSVPKLITVGLVTAGLLTAVSVVDWLQPADQRSHLGRFVQTVLDGGAWQVVSRKAAGNLSILFSSVLSLLVPFAALFLALVLMRPSSWGARALARAYDRSPVLRQGLTCLLVLLGIGFAVNDSGTAIPAVGATLAIPLIIAVSMQALLDDEPARPEPAAAPARSTAPPPGDSPG